MDKEAVKMFVDQAETTLDASPQMDEEATKFRLILPFIEILGWDPRSTEVEPEHTVRMATGKAKVDFALLVGETPVVFVEAKPARSSLDEDSVAQLRSYMRQELDVDWGVVTNGRSFEVLTKGNDGRQEEISLIQFELDDLKERPELLEILSKDSIQSGKSDEIATQIAHAGEAIRHLQDHREQVATDLTDVLLERIETPVPLDIDAQSIEFVNDLISALEEQRQAIGTTASPKDDSPPEINGETGISGEYVANIQNEGTALATFADDNQSDVMAEAVNYLIENHGLRAEIEPLPYVPGEKNALINETPTHPDGDREMRTYRQLTDGSYLFTSFNKRDKKRHISRLVNLCGLEVEFENEW